MTNRQRFLQQVIQSMASLVVKAIASAEKLQKKSTGS